ncbi:hypothetical protein ABH944_008712 [Caballeronia udeis]|uniref:Uncharacterized protein n=1 Tax=Caballeronia udeis TaxID=1232866 RepID=A0ABW8MY65_9BURK
MLTTQSPSHAVSYDGQTAAYGAKTFEIVDTAQGGTTFGFEIFYSAELKASHATDAKNTLTVKFAMHGTQAIQ